MSPGDAKPDDPRSAPVAAESTALLPLSRDTDEWSETLEQYLLDAQFAESLQTLEGYARKLGPDSVLPVLMVATIRRLERLWGSDLVPDATLTMAFAMARQLIEQWKSQNQHRAPARVPVNAETPVLVCVAPGDEHTFGAQILSDDLMMRGWAVDLMLSSHMDVLLDRVARKSYAAVMVSVGQDASLADLGNLIIGMRSVSAKHDVLVVLGGSGLAQPYAQYHFLKADLIAGSAAQGAGFLASRLSQRLAGTRN